MTDPKEDTILMQLTAEEATLIIMGLDAIMKMFEIGDAVGAVPPSSDFQALTALKIINLSKKFSDVIEAQKG